MMDFFEKLERIRRSILWLFFAAGLSFAGGIVLLALKYLIAFLPFALSLLFLALVALRVSHFKRYYKQNLARAMLEDVFDDLDYRADEGLPFADIKASGMVATGNQYECGDYIGARYKGIRFRQSDVRLLQNTRGTQRTLFSGRWMIFEFAEPFGFVLQVKEKSFANLQQPVGQGIPLDKIYFEDEGFHRFFSVYTNDEKKARYILSSEFREAILKVNYEIWGDIMFCFQDNTLHVALNGTRDSFEPPAFKSLNRNTLEKEAMADIRVICAFIDSLPLDNKLLVSEKTDQSDCILSESA